MPREEELKNLIEEMEHDLLIAKDNLQEAKEQLQNYKDGWDIQFGYLYIISIEDGGEPELLRLMFMDRTKVCHVFGKTYNGNGMSEMERANISYIKAKGYKILRCLTSFDLSIACGYNSENNSCL